MDGFIENDGVCIDTSDPKLTPDNEFPTLVDFVLVNKKFDIDELSIKF